MLTSMVKKTDCLGTLTSVTPHFSWFCRLPHSVTGFKKLADKNIHRDIKLPMFAAALLAIARTWKQQPKCPSTDKLIKKMWYIHTTEYYLSIKNDIMPFAAT